MSEDLLQLHCEDKSSHLFGALDALLSLSNDERKLVLKALKTGNTQSLQNFMADYRRQLAHNMSL